MAVRGAAFDPACGSVDSGAEVLLDPAGNFGDSSWQTRLYSVGVSVDSGSKLPLQLPAGGSAYSGRMFRHLTAGLPSLADAVAMN